jgi:3-dehydroquinate synthetase
MTQDKKNKGDKILMALPNGLGQAVWDQEVSAAEIRDAFKHYESL